MKYIGLDVHSENIYCAVIDEQGNLIHHDCFNTSLENLINLSEKLKHPLSLVFLRRSPYGRGRRTRRLALPGASISL